MFCLSSWYYQCVVSQKINLYVKIVFFLILIWAVSCLCSHVTRVIPLLQLILAGISGSDAERPPNIITDKNLKLLFELQKKVLDIHLIANAFKFHSISNCILQFWKVDDLRANYSGSMVSLTDICLKPLGKDCATQSVLQVHCAGIFFHQFT